MVIQITVEDGGDHNHHQIDHNIFGYRKPFGGNGAEIIYAWVIPGHHNCLPTVSSKKIYSIIVTEKMKLFQ